MKVGGIKTLMLVIALAFAGSITQALAQTKEKVYTTVTQQAEFPGGMEALYKYLAKNIHYPEAARNKNVQGKVFLTFIVEKNGSLSDIKVVKGVGSGCDEESVRVIKASPKWHPGKEKGKVVRQSYTIPISFTLA